MPGLESDTAFRAKWGGRSKAQIIASVVIPDAFVVASIVYAFADPEGATALTKYVTEHWGALRSAIAEGFDRFVETVVPTSLPYKNCSLTGIAHYFEHLNDKFPNQEEWLKTQHALELRGGHWVHGPSMVGNSKFGHDLYEQLWGYVGKIDGPTFRAIEIAGGYVDSDGVTYQIWQDKFGHVVRQVVPSELGLNYPHLTKDGHLIVPKALAVEPKVVVEHSKVVQPTPKPGATHPVPGHKHVPDRTSELNLQELSKYAKKIGTEMVNGTLMDVWKSLTHDETYYFPHR